MLCALENLGPRDSSLELPSLPSLPLKEPCQDTPVRLPSRASFSTWKSPSSLAPLLWSLFYILSQTLAPPSHQICSKQVTCHKTYKALTHHSIIIWPRVFLTRWQVSREQGQGFIHFWFSSCPAQRAANHHLDSRWRLKRREPRYLLWKSQLSELTIIQSLGNFTSSLLPCPGWGMGCV